MYHVLTSRKNVKIIKPKTDALEVYICILFVSGPPVIYIPRTSYTVSSGYTVTLDVNVTSFYDLTDLFWEKRNISSNIYEPIDMQSDSRLECGNITCPSLTIIGVDKNDEAYFRVNATNQDGTTTGSNIRIYVILDLSTYL